jgi:hypothetical protein
MYGILVLEWNEFITWPLHKFSRYLNERRIALKTLTNYDFDNQHYCFHDICGNLYAFSLDKEKAQSGSIADKQHREQFGQDYHYDGIYYAHVWDYKGQQSIYSKTFSAGREGYNKTVPQEVAKEIEEATKNYREGIVRCSDCGKATEAGARRMYFAATYCGDCWAGLTGRHTGKGGWHDVEAKETYD